MTESGQNKKNENQILKCLTLTNSVVFPHIIFPVVIDVPSLKKLISDAEKGDKIVSVFPESIPDHAEPDTEPEIFSVGVRCRILKHFTTDGGETRVIFHAMERIRLNSFIKTQKTYRLADISILEERSLSPIKAEAYRRTISELLQRIIDITPIYPEEVQDVILSVENPSKLSDLIVAALDIQYQEKCSFLKELSVFRRLQKLVKTLKKELKILELNEKINDSVRQSVNKQQKDFILREQLEIIKKELGESDGENPDEEDMRVKMDKLKLSEEAESAVNKELERLSLMSPYSSDYNVTKTYIDWILSLPWGQYTRDSLNIRKSSRILEKDHYGLQDVKDRILEYLAVLQLKKDANSPILCLVGPPGVGKTSLGQSIARAMARKFIRFSVGGMRDEAEIRGHRKTYIGAMPGRIIQYLKRCGSQNPLIMLDEVDKIGNDFRGDPASALLEVLDPEQNKDFRDNYLEIAFDLSKVLFIATANTTHTIPSALLDRMEIIQIPGYITPEKQQIAKKYLIPKQTAANGLPEKNIHFTPKSIESIIENYTLEAGVRNLEKQIGRICRKLARNIASSKEIAEKIRITPAALENYLGPKMIFKDHVPGSPQIGVAVGLAYTASGGDVLPVEATLMTGHGKYKTTGQLGNVMKESVETAVSYLRSTADRYGIEKVKFFENDFHLHFPAAAIPKDGPSAGITVTTALLSCLTSRKIRHDIAMTGEISLRGNVLPVGGIREKVTAARRMNIKTVIMPKTNKADLVKVPEHVRSGLNFIFVESYDKVVNYIFA